MRTPCHHSNLAVIDSHPAHYSNLSVLSPARPSQPVFALAFEQSYLLTYLLTYFTYLLILLTYLLSRAPGRGALQGLRVAHLPRACSLPSARSRTTARRWARRARRACRACRACAAACGRITAGARAFCRSDCTHWAADPPLWGTSRTEACAQVQGEAARRERWRQSLWPRRRASHGAWAARRGQA